MKRVYAYKGFEVTVELDPVWAVSGNVTLLEPQGYVAIVHIRTADTARPMVAPIRLVGDG